MGQSQDHKPELQLCFKIGEMELRGNEVDAIGLALAAQLESLETFPRQDLKSLKDKQWLENVISSTKSAKEKFEKLAGQSYELPPYEEGDDEKFLKL